MRMDYKSDPSGGPSQDVLNTAYGQFAAAGRTFEPWFWAAARGNLEVFTLATRRAQAYVELPVRLSQCRTPKELADEQMRFWQNMTQQYAECSQKVMRIWTDLAQNGSRRGRSAQRDYITFPEPEEASGQAEQAERRAA